MPVQLDDFHYFIDVHITRTELLKPPLCCWIRYCIGSINSTILFARLLHFVTLVGVILKNVSYFLFLFISILERSNTQLASPNTKLEMNFLKCTLNL
uniref:Uncharacterized protein n=1 Tax=Lepeophtheirus salmonis TaxID=72036 RepID=A0A0K2VJZ5_LEPSM